MVVRVKVTPGRLGAPTRRFAPQPEAPVRRQLSPEELEQRARGIQEQRRQEEINKIETLKERKLAELQALESKISNKGFSTPAEDDKQNRLSGEVAGLSQAENAAREGQFITLEDAKQLANRRAAGVASSAFASRQEREAATQERSTLTTFGPRQRGGVRVTDVSTPLGATSIITAGPGAFDAPVTEVIKGANLPTGTVTAAPSQPILSFRETLISPGGTVSAATISAGLSGAQEKIRGVRSTTFISRSRGQDVALPASVFSFGAGVATPFVGTARFAQEATKDPVILVTGPVEVVQKGLTTGFPEVSRTIREDPEFSAGVVVGEAALFKATAAPLRGLGLAKEFTLSKVGPTARTIKTLPTGERIVENLGDVGRLGLIPGGKGLAKTGPATVRGGFGFSKTEQASLRGKTGPITTTARDLFKGFSDEALIEGTEVGLDISGKPKTFKLFATPFDPKTRTAQTRISRLGSVKEAGFKDLIDFSEDISFRKPKPQIVIFPKQTIGKTFKPFGKATQKGIPTSELEVAITDPGVVAFKRRKLGKIFLKGRKVDILEADFKRDAKLANIARKLEAGTATQDEIATLSRGTGFDLSSRPVGTKKLSLSRFVTPSSKGTSIKVKPTKKVTGIKFKEFIGIESQRTSKVPKRINLRPLGFSGGSLSPVRRGTPIRRSPKRPPVRRPIPRRSTRITPTPRTPGRILTPTIRPPAPVRARGERKKIKGRKRSSRFQDEAFLTAGFTGRVLGRRRKLSTADVRKAARKKIGGIGIRGTPVIR